MEEWINIRGYPNYMISSHGRVYNSRTGKELKTSSNNRYESVELFTDGHSSRFLILESSFSDRLPENLIPIV